MRVLSCNRIEDLSVIEVCIGTRRFSAVMRSVRSFQVHVVESLRRSVVGPCVNWLSRLRRPSFKAFRSGSYHMPLSALTRTATVVAFFLILATLAGCGGGGGSGGAPGSDDDDTPNNTPAPPPLTNSTNLEFVEVQDIGFDRPMTGNFATFTDPERFGGGIAAGDYDRDGDFDLYVVGRDSSPNHLYENQGDGTFVEVGAELGVAVTHWGSGPAFGDIDGDGDLDLFVGAVQNGALFMFENRINEREGKFVDITIDSLIRSKAANTVSALFFDYDLDGYLDLFHTHWGARWSEGVDTERLWRNNGNNTFSSASRSAGLGIIEQRTDWSFTPNLTDIDGDGDADFLMANDFGTSQVFGNNGDGTFSRITNRDVIIDQSGMGAAVADYDNDGDMDWFVTSIYNLDIQGGESFGNRLYRNYGDGRFEDVTDYSGTANGEWGWAACAADFDQDTHIDIAMVNGWIALQGKDYRNKPIKFFRNLGPGIEFREMADEVGITNRGQGRGMVCFDADGDGDQDIVVMNNSADHLVFYRNDTDNDNNYFVLELRGLGKNRMGVGSRIKITTEDGSQIRDLGGSNNYVSHNPLVAHFGVGTATTVDIEVRWPDGTITNEEGVEVNQRYVMRATEQILRLSVVGGTGAGVYLPGDTVSLVAAEPEEHYYFSHWSVNGEGTFSDIYSFRTTFTMPEETVTVTAHYIPGAAPDADVSIARRWMEVLLQSIRNDWARPTVHARNLFHASSAMYDSWLAYGDTDETTWLLGREQNDIQCDWTKSDSDADEDTILENRAETLSYAVYRIIRKRFQHSPRASQIRSDIDAMMGFLGYNINNDSTDWESGSPAALGNYLAGCYLDFGDADGANESEDYANQVYRPVNRALRPSLPGNPNITNHNRWQPLVLDSFIDQAGNPATDDEPEFLGPEWGSVYSFALEDDDLDIYQRDGWDYWVFHDPGGPPLTGSTNTTDNYLWGFSLVSIWSAHLDHSDGVMWDISPVALGNITSYPEATDYDSYDQFYNRLEGGDPSVGYTVNPVTGEPYQSQFVPRGDYTRVLAEFWADGPDSETPPGHWFVILNTVNDHPLLDRRLGGIGPVLDDFEWDIKSYFALGGAMHDAAIAAWGLKGWYDYIRPISAIRAMADLGQSSDPDGANYDANGMPLVGGYIDLVLEGDDLVGENGENLNKIKVLAWRGPDYIEDPSSDQAGVGWILAENWWPYQRPTFVTPPFAGFVSGHSTYSRAAAEVMTALTGSPYFPGGMSQFEITANEFLVFEEGPSVNMTLQWATYYDASDQCSLSRIWGGIHPPADDIPGRLIGIKIGQRAFAHAKRFFDGENPE